MKGDTAVRRLRGLARIGVVTAALTLLVPFAAAQDKAPLPPPVKSKPKLPRPIDPADPSFRGAVLGDDFSGIDVGDERVIYAVGGISQPVWIRQPGFEVRCDRVVVWGNKEGLLDGLRSKDEKLTSETLLGPLVHAVYAEGDVVLKRDSYHVRAERVFIDFAQNRAYMVEAHMSGDAKEREDGTKVPFHVRAEVIRGKAKDQFTAESAAVTTCSYEHPHVQFTVDEIDLDFSEEYVRFRSNWFPRIEADTLAGEHTPVFIVPLLGGRAFDLDPLKGVNFANSDRFGTVTEIQWGGKLETEKGEEWGKWTLHTDYRSRRGVGLGGKLEGEGKARGRFGDKSRWEAEGYYQRDEKSTDGFSELPFDGTPGSSNDENRGRMHGWGRQYLPDDFFGGGWRVEGEFSLYSDRGYLAEFERQKVLEDKQQDTYVQLRKTLGNDGVTLLTSYTLNDESAYLARSVTDLRDTDFQNQTSYLPSLAYHLINEPIFSKKQTGLVPVNLSIEASAAHMDRRYDDLYEDALKTVGVRGRDVTRGDLETRVTTPFDVGPLHFNPAVGGSYMAVDSANGIGNKNLFVDDDGSDNRYAGFAALRVGTQAHKQFDAQNDFFELNGLRHVVSVDTQYFNRFEVSEDESSFQANDMVDSLVEQEVGSVRIRNRLQTKRDGEIVDWIDFEYRYLHYFDETETMYGGFGRQLGFREDFAQPLQRLDFAGEDKYRFRERDGGAFHQNRVRIQALSNVWLVGEGDYDVDVHEWETTNAGVRYFATRKFSVYVGRRTIRHDSVIYSVQADYRLTNKWAFTMQQQVNRRGSRDRLGTTVGVWRRAHDITYALEVDADALVDENTVSFAIYPNDWLSGGKGNPFSKRRELDYDALKWYR